MKQERPDYELPIEGVAWTRGSGHPAGFFLHAGHMHLAALGSPAAEALVERGALHVASVRFDREPAERSFAGAWVSRLDARAALARFGAGG